DLLARHPMDKTQLQTLKQGLALLTDEELAQLELGDRAEIENELAETKKATPFLAVGLVHWPVVDKANQVVCTNVTNLDIHDVARSARVYGVDRYYIINRQQAQLAFVQRILEHWKIGEGSHYNHMRQTALGPVE